MNAIAPGRRSRTKEAISAVRHVFLEADHDGQQVLRRIAARGDLPAPSYVLHSSPNRVHVFWRATGFTVEHIERLQKHLAYELDTDVAATPASQLTRLPGLFNHKYLPPHGVSIEYGDTGRLWTPFDFPEREGPAQWSPARRQSTVRHGSNSERARRYLETIPPAIAGEHGDLHTFRVCCRLVRGFALDDDEAVTLLASWNLRCIPPWSERDLQDKLLRARAGTGESRSEAFWERRCRRGDARFSPNRAGLAQRHQSPSRRRYALSHRHNVSLNPAASPRIYPCAATLIFVNWNLISEFLRTIDALSREPIRRVGVRPEIGQPAVEICLGSAIGKVDFLHNKV